MSDDQSRGDGVWAGDWRGRALEALRRLGFDDFLGLAKSNACESYAALAEMLGEHVAPIQLMWLIRDGYARSNDVQGFVADSLTRHAIEHLAEGAGGSTSREYRVASVFADWRTSLGDVNAAAALAVWKELKPKILEGWIPASINDPEILAVVSTQQWIA